MNQEKLLTNPNFPQDFGENASENRIPENKQIVY